MNLPLKGNTNDYSVNNITITPINSPTNATGIFGESNGSIELNGTNQILDIPNDVTYHIRDSYNSSGFTILLNVLYLGAVNTIGYMFAGAQVWAVNRYFLYAYDARTAEKKYSFSVYNSNGEIGETSLNDDNISDGNWKSLAYKGKVSEQYITNFETDTNTTFSGNMQTADKSIKTTIGARDNSGYIQYLKAKLCNFRIYPVTLTDGEIAVLNQQLGRVA
jgi:hypothetical protein